MSNDDKGAFFVFCSRLVFLSTCVFIMHILDGQAVGFFCQLVCSSCTFILHCLDSQAVGFVCQLVCSLCTSRVPGQNGISQACYIVEIYHSGPEPSTFILHCLDSQAVEWPPGEGEAGNHPLLHPVEPCQC